MNETFNPERVEHLHQSLSSHSEKMTIWTQLNAQVTKGAETLHHQAEQNGLPLSPLHSWWQACYELCSGYQMKISQVEYGEEEYIVLTNHGPAIVDLSHWTLISNLARPFVFPPQTHLLPGDSIRVDVQRYAALSFHHRGRLLSVSGDKLELRDNRGICVSSWVYEREATNFIVINYLSYDGQEKYTEADEFVELMNISPHWVDLSGWRLSSVRGKQVFVFAKRSKLAPFATCRVYTNHFDANTGGYSFQSPRAIWHNKGDEAQLHTAHGDMVYCYAY
ncbi:lamin tail domain-containing protein [Pseudoalteromonas xiamenensis]|uniref:lamin tail domain-containing protein n=1 Tax=Pseudoalteromonas xiamenensis TaxID=882626 RepID=UPI0035EF5DE4